MPDYYIGLMSGTSMDGIDAALVEFSDDQFKLVESHSHRIPDQLISTIQQLALNKSDLNLDTLCETDVELGNTFADAANALLIKSNIKARSIKAIGSHGQTIWHKPMAKHPFSLQIGNANNIAYKTGITTVADFRQRDIAAGGEGAPLAPAFHNNIFRNKNKNRTVLNIGGIANATYLPADKNKSCTGFDTGPGNTLMDCWIKKHLQKNFDKDGEWAASAQANSRLVEQLMQDIFIHKTPPKSTGREYYNLHWLNEQLKSFENIKADIVQASLCEFTAQSIQFSINNFLPDTQTMIVCGGGVHNFHLMQRLKKLLPEIQIDPSDQHGLAADWVEAVAFAWLAKQTMEGKTGNLMGVTGAEQDVILGAIYSV
jgi:anhydro-N-acetylmuramic acid kinase